MRLASTITPLLTGISTLYSTTNNNIVSSFTPSSSNVVSRRLINNKLYYYSSNNKNEIIDGSHQLTVHELDISSTATADTQSQQQNVVGRNDKKMNRRQLLKQCTISSLLGIVQLSGCNEAWAEVETVKDTDVDASTLPEEATTELTKSSSSSTDTDTADNIDEIKSSDEIKESTTEVKSETAAAESSTTSTKVEVVDKKETSNKKEDNEEYKAMKSIVDTYKSGKSSGSSGSGKSKVAVGSTPPSTAAPSDALTSVITKDLSGFIVPATLLAGSATIASSILSNTDEINGEKSILSTSVKDQANEMTRKNMQKRSEWKMDTPTPYGLQDGSPKQLVPPKGSDWERIDGSAAGGSSSSAAVEEKKPIEPSLKGSSSSASSSMPKPTDKVKAQKSISMAKLVKEGTTKQKQQQKKEEWKGIDKPTPYGLKSDTPKYTSPNESSESVNFGEKALAAVSASKTTSQQPLKGSATTTSSSGNISMSNIVKGTEDPTQIKKKVLTLDNKGRKVWQLESASSWIQTLATGGNSSKQKGKDWKGLPPPLSDGSKRKGGGSATASSSSIKEGTNKEEALLSVAEKKAAMKKDVQRSSSISDSASSPPPVANFKATKSISMAKIVKGATSSSSPPPPAAEQQQQSMFNSLPTKGSSAKAPIKKSFAKTTLKGAMKAAQSAIDSGTTSQQQQPTPVAKVLSQSSSGGDNGPVKSLPTPSYSAKSNIMGGSNDNVVPVKKSFAKGSFKMKSSTPVSDNKMVGSSAPVSGEGMGGGSSSSSSTAAFMPSSSVTMKGSASPPSSPSSSGSSDVPVKKSFSKSSFKKSSTGKGSPGGWAVSSSPIESSISALPVTPVAKQAAPVSLPPPPVTKGAESSSPNTQGSPKSPVSAVKKSYGKSSFKGSSSSGGAGGMLKGSSQLFGAGPTPKSSTSFGKSVTNKKKTFGKSISMANVMKQGSSGASSGGGDDGFLSGLEQSSVPSSSSSSVTPDPSSNAAVLLPKQVSTSEPPPQVPKVETPQVTPPKMEAEQASNQVRQPPPQMPPPLGQIGNSEASGVRIGSANRFGNTQPATFAAPVNRGRRQQQQQQQARTPAVAEKENEPRQAAQSARNKETQSAAPAVTTVTITDPRTGKKRTITTSSNLHP